MDCVDFPWVSNLHHSCCMYDLLKYNRVVDLVLLDVLCNGSGSSRNATLSDLSRGRFFATRRVLPT